MLHFVIISIFFSLLLQGNYRLLTRVEAEGDQHYSDPMGNVYIVKDNLLTKYSSEYQQTGHYTNTFLGNIYSVDVSDPLRILLYYKDHNQIVWVDNFLSELRSPVWLDDLGIDQAELVCASSQGGFWVFNSLNNQLQFFSVNLELLHESPTLNILTGPDINPSFMIEKSRTLYLNVPGTGILVFDRFGNYSKTLPLETPSFFQVTDNHIYFMQEGGLFSYDLRTAEIAGLDLPEPWVEASADSRILLKAELQPGLMYLYTSQGYRVYETSP
jgi:hypothetical protein